MRVHALAGALGLGGRAAARVGPDAGARGPRGPVDVTGARPVRQGRVGRAEVVGHGLLGRELHHPELLPRPGLVLARGQEVDEVVALGHFRAHVGEPGGVAVGADVAVARVARGAGGAALELHGVLVVLARHRVRAEPLEVDAVAPAGVLHPVLVHGVAAVDGVRLVQEVLVELGDLVAGHATGFRAGVAEHGGPLGLRHDERLVGVVEQDQRALEGAHRALDGGVGPVGAGDLPVVALPRHVVGVDPVLRVDGAGEPGLGRHAGGVGGLLPGLPARPVVELPVVQGVVEGSGGHAGVACGERGDREQRGDQQGRAPSPTTDVCAVHATSVVSTHTLATGDRSAWSRGHVVS